eukprot:TRINITY_DN3325_c0_g1_i1.p1 TRINITY_DN3325_c0_g1~~TRINITY_DN3325_c0_g1_i1.p1  ORF type:complete len:190 (+),score=1.01 TRINITY_DN3325_c0_g1_i1:64-633(+)
MCIRDRIEALLEAMRTPPNEEVDQGPVRGTRGKYSLVNNECRQKLIHIVQQRAMSMRQASIALGINYSTAKTIIGSFRKEGKISKSQKSKSEVPVVKRKRGRPKKSEKCPEPQQEEKLAEYSNFSENGAMMSTIESSHIQSDNRLNTHEFMQATFDEMITRDPFMEEINRMFDFQTLPNYCRQIPQPYM